MNSSKSTVKEHYGNLIGALSEKLNEVDLLKVVTLMQTTIDSRECPYTQLSKKIDRCAEFSKKEGVAIVTGEQKTNKELAQKIREEYEKANPSPACPGIIIREVLKNTKLSNEVKRLEDFLIVMGIRFHKKIINVGQNRMAIISYGDKYHEVSVKIYDTEPENPKTKVEYYLHWINLNQNITNHIGDVKDYDGFVRWFDEFN